MKSLKLVLTGLALAGGAAAFAIFAADSTFRSIAAQPAVTHPALYSFVDVYRLTVAGASAGFPPVEGAAEAPVRVAAAQPLAGAELRFLISPVRQPDKWLLLLAGVALAGWVAHRRLAHSL